MCGKSHGGSIILEVPWHIFRGDPANVRRSLTGDVSMFDRIEGRFMGADSNWGPFKVLSPKLAIIP